MSFGDLRAFGSGAAPRLAAVVLAAAASSSSIGGDGRSPPRAPVAPLRVVLQAKPAGPAKPVAPARPPSAFARESALSYKELMDRWDPDIRRASRRFAVPDLWIRAVMTIESGGRTMMAENAPITSSAGAMGLMQIMPKTWHRMRRQYGLGNDPYDPHDNIMAGAAYLHELDEIYGYPGLFAAYNDGPGMLEAHRRLRQMMPEETTAYVWNIASILSTGARLPPRRAEDAVDPAPADPAPGPVASIRIKRQRPPADENDEDYDEH
ncbi:MAG: lytic transglycosylase domain-containing protein [Rhizomicrobium sp.]